MIHELQLFVRKWTVDGPELDDLKLTHFVSLIS